MAPSLVYHGLIRALLSLTLSQAQRWEKKNLFDVTCRPYSNLNHSLHN